MVNFFKQVIISLLGFVRTFYVKRKNVGSQTYISPKAQIIGWNRVKIGNYTNISDDCIININFNENKGYALEIGNNCYIGRRAFFSTGLKIKIGDYSLVTNDCKFLGSGHRINDPLIPYICAGTTSDEIIDIGTNCWISSGVTILENVKVGHGSIIGAQALVNVNIPPFSIAVGSPCRVIKRYNFNLKLWIPVDQVKNEDELAIPNEEEYLSILKQNYPEITMPLHISSIFFGDSL